MRIGAMRVSAQASVHPGLAGRGAQCLSCIAPRPLRGPRAAGVFGPWRHGPRAWHRA
ncbi:hypothetical protein FHT17_001748 [Novosphingobium sp. SG916]|nr:hypothetical protein [Novosphingobium sp. SG916]